MQVDLVAIFLLLLFGCAAFVFGLLCLIGRTFVLIGRFLRAALFGSEPFDPERTGRIEPVDTQRCPRCGKAEERPARFCGQCGLRFSGDSG